MSRWNKRSATNHTVNRFPRGGRGMVQREDGRYSPATRVAPPMAPPPQSFQNGQQQQQQGDSSSYLLLETHQSQGVSDVPQPRNCPPMVPPQPVGHTRYSRHGQRCYGSNVLNVHPGEAQGQRVIDQFSWHDYAAPDYPHSPGLYGENPTVSNSHRRGSSREGSWLKPFEQYNTQHGATLVPMYDGGHSSAYGVPRRSFTAVGDYDRPEPYAQYAHGGQHLYLEH